MALYSCIMGTPILAVNVDNYLSVVRNPAVLQRPHPATDKCLLALVYGVRWRLDVKNRRRQQRRLSWPAIVEIAIHIGPAERSLNWIDRPILIAIEFLKMVVRQFRIVQVRNTGAKMISARIVALRIFQHAVVHKIGSWLHDGFRDPLPMNLHTTKAPGV